MKRFLSYCTKHQLLVVVVLFLCLQLVSLTIPSVISWDGSVYAGMAKYMASMGEIGVWEVLRPIGFPLLIGLFTSVGFDAYIVAHVIAIISSVFCIIVVYMLAEKIKEHSGVYASLLLSGTPLFFRFAHIPMTDILSTTLALSALYFLTGAKDKKGYIIAGICAGLAFLFRFPHGLVLAVMIGVLFMQWLNENQNESFRFVCRKIWWTGLGFAVIATPFLVANLIAYGDPILPLKAGAGIIAHNPIMYKQHWFFYVTSLIHANVVFLFASIPILLFGLRREFRKNSALVSVIVFIAVYVVYFSITAHKEYRYMLGFLPGVAVLAGVGVFQFLHTLPKRFRWIFLGIALFIFIPWSVQQGIFTSQKNDLVYEQIGSYFNQYANEKGNPARVISAAPFIVARSPVLITATLYDDWRSVMSTYETHAFKSTHVLTDTCTLEAVCPFDDGCTVGKNTFEERMVLTARVVQSGSVGSCRVMLYELK
jgi:4-amino-4-deoxy-L-arabinose transferase-like glycosyltransferase